MAAYFEIFFKTYLNGKETFNKKHPAFVHLEQSKSTKFNRIDDNNNAHNAIIFCIVVLNLITYFSFIEFNTYPRQGLSKKRKKNE